MSVVEEGKFAMADGHEVYSKTWKPTKEPIAAMIYIHGFSDHCGRYDTVFPQYNEAGIIVYAFDQRGWGKSATTPALKGKTGRTAQVLGDIEFFIKAHLPSPVPLFMMGHSMGGQETLHFIATGSPETKKQLKGFILSSPYLALHPSEQPGWLKVKAGRLALNILPNFQLVNPLKAETMSHDPVMNQSLVDDPLCHDTGTLEGLGDMLDRAEALDTGKTLIEDWEGLHMLFLHGDADACTRHESTKRYFERISVKNKNLKLYPGGYHCLYYEPDHKKQFIADVVDFITTRTREETAQSKL